MFVKELRGEGRGITHFKSPARVPKRFLQRRCGWNRRDRHASSNRDLRNARKPIPALSRALKRIKQQRQLTPTLLFNLRNRFLLSSKLGLNASGFESAT